LSLFVLLSRKFLASDPFGTVVVAYQAPPGDKEAPTVTKGDIVSINGKAITHQGTLQLHAASTAKRAALLPVANPQAARSHQGREWFSVGHASLSHPNPASTVARSCGVLLLRGRKCLLCRDATGQGAWEGLTYPHTVAALEETSQSAAVRALADGCDLDPDQFYLLQHVPPAVFYKADPATGKVCEVVTIYLAASNNPPPEGAAPDDWQDEEDEEDEYDWFLYQYALNALRSQEERDALTALALSVQRASNAGLVAVRWGLGVFGEGRYGIGDAEGAILAEPFEEEEEEEADKFTFSFGAARFCQPCAPTGEVQTVDPPAAGEGEGGEGGAPAAALGDGEEV